MRLRKKAKIALVVVGVTAAAFGAVAVVAATAVASSVFLTEGWACNPCQR
jgi:hypothetical protein